MSVVKTPFPGIMPRQVMDWTRYYIIVVCLMLFVLSVHIFTFDEQVSANTRQKRDTSSLGGNDSAVLTFDDSTDTLDISNVTSSTPPNLSILDVTNASQSISNASSDVSFSNNSVVTYPSQTTTFPQSAVSIPIVPERNSTNVPNDVGTRNATTETIAQNTTADNLQPSVINTTTSSPTTEREPDVELTTEETTQSTEGAVVIIPQTKVPTTPSSTLSPGTTSSTILIKGDVEDKEGSLSLLAIVLPVAIFLVLVTVFIAVICCRYGNLICKKCRKTAVKRRQKGDGNDLWVEDGGIDNVAVMHDEEDLPTEKGSEVDSVVISAQMYGGKLYEVDYGFQASEDSHLDLAPGTIVEVVEKLDSGWWRGYSGETDGWFPATYVHTLDKRHQNPDAISSVNQGFDVEEELEKFHQDRAETAETTAKKDSKDLNLQASPVSLQDKLLQAISQEVNKKNQYIAVADYTAVKPDEISVSRGECLIHINKDPSGWTQVRRDATAEIGWVPSSYIQQNSNGDEVFLDDGGNELVVYEGEDDYYTDEELDDTVDWEAEFDEDHDEVTGIEHHAIHEYKAKQEGDLSFEAGDIVIVFEMLANGWWRGCSAGQEGWFPATYVEAVAQTPRESDCSSGFELSLLPEPKRVCFHTENNIEYPDLATSSLERRMQADQKEKENDPLYSPGSLSQEDKPLVPVRFVTPKLVRVNRGTLTRSAHKLNRPRRPAPPPPAGVEPYRTLTKHSMRRKRKPPPPPKRTSPTKAYPSQPPPPPQRTVSPKLKITKSISSSHMSPTTSPSPNQSPGVESSLKPNRPAPSRPVPPSPGAILEARKQSIASIGSSGSLLPPPPMFMDTMQKDDKAKQKQIDPPKPAKRTSIEKKMLENDTENNTVHPTSDIRTSINSLDRYASIDSKGSGSSWGQGSTLDKKDRPVMAVKPVMKFVQGDAWKQDIKRTSSSSIPQHNSTSSPEGRSAPLAQVNSSGLVSANTMRVAPQLHTDQLSSKPKSRPNPPPRKSISSGSVPLQEIQPSSPGNDHYASRPSTSSTDSGKPAPPRPPPPRPTGPPPPPSGVVMRQKANGPGDSAAKRKSTLRRAAKSHQSAENGHLNFQEDSFIKELGEAPGKPGWMLGMLADGTTGIYPKDRVEQITQGVRVSRV